MTSKGGKGVYVLFSNEQKPKDKTGRGKEERVHPSRESRRDETRRGGGKLTPLFEGVSVNKAIVTRITKHEARRG